MDKQELIEQFESLVEYCNTSESAVCICPKHYTKVARSAIQHLEYEPFDVLNAVHNRVDIADMHGNQWKYDKKSKEYVSKDGIKLSAIDLADHKQWQPCEPKPELEIGKNYLCSWGAHHIIAHITPEGKWESSMFNGAYYSNEELEPILKDGKPVEVDV